MSTSESSWSTLNVIKDAALSRLSPTVREFLENGSGREFTLRRNRAMFDSWAFAQQVLSGRDVPDLSTSYLGFDLRLPVLTAPFGADKLFHAAGQTAVVQAAQDAGTVSIVPEASSFSLEDLRSAAPRAAQIGQFHPMGSEENVMKIIRRYEAAGYEALCLTLDCPTPGWREHNLRNGYVISSDVVGGNYPPGAEVAMEQALGQLYEHREPVWSWSQVRDLMTQSSLPWIAKGIMSPRDAERALEAGASSLLVSNHGGRQLDGVLSSIEVLPSVASAAAKHVPIAVDSGVRNGADVVKALALGADVIVIGRLAAYGLAADGKVGVDRVFDLLASEMTTILTLLGHGDARELTSDALIRVG